LQDWQQEQKLKPENGGSQSKLNTRQTQQLVRHIEATLYTKVQSVCEYVVIPLPEVGHQQWTPKLHATVTIYN